MKPVHECTAEELLAEQLRRDANRRFVRIHFMGTVPDWLRHQVERYWTTHRPTLRDPMWDLEYLDVYLQLPR